MEGFAGLGRGLAAAEDLFGSDAVLQLVRVMGAAMARVADAVVSAFLVNVEPHALQEQAVGLAIARANAAGGRAHSLRGAACSKCCCAST